MNSIDRQYKELLEHILQFGVDKADRTGTGTKSVFGWQIRHNMKEGFPLLTTKKMAFKSMVTELLWFLRGDTNIKFLVHNDCNIWNGDAYKNYEKITKREVELNEAMNTHPHYRLSKEEFINMIKTNDEFAKKWGDLGPVYGKQWRYWESEIVNYSGMKYQREPIDQISNLISELKTNPNSRRLMVSAWNVGELNQMVLPPCHYSFQCYVRDGKYLSLMWNQRSVDTFLGLPFNIASYALLLEIIAKEVGMIPDELIGNLGDVHLYNNHIEQAKEQITRTPYELPKVNFNTEWWDKPFIEAIMSDNFCKCLLEEDIQLINYQSHPVIKAPLSN
jgi:thymidylate synthase